MKRLHIMTFHTCLNELNSSTRVHLPHLFKRIEFFNSCPVYIREGPVLLCCSQFSDRGALCGCVVVCFFVSSLEYLRIKHFILAYFDLSCYKAFFLSQDSGVMSRYLVHFKSLLLFYVLISLFYELYSWFCFVQK